MKKKTIVRRPGTRKKKSTSTIPRSDNSLYVVAIGASAGGLEALEAFFKHMPVHSGMSFIVVSHLDPNHVSIMPELIQKCTMMKLLQAQDGMKVEPDHVYVVPANRDLAILHGTIQLIEPVEAHGFRLPIDFTFKSLAADLGEKAICIILSGMASDGTVGLRAVKSALGMVMVQDPASAKFDGMPGSAIKTGLADYVLSPEEMPERLVRYISQKAKGVALPGITEGRVPDDLQKLFILLRTHTGHDFSLYKHNTIYRRVERRMTLAQLDSMSQYLRMLQENPAELQTLFKELLIGVTTFFRDPESFVRLKEILSELVKNKPEDGRIRIWVPGCSTGEEAYSVAIILRECMNEAEKTLDVQIFATDIDGVAIEKGRIGSFSGIASDVGKERLSRFFTSEGNVFRIRKDIREMLIFAQHSVIKDPPFTKLDLITCRNLLIYFNATLQKKVIPIFHYSLAPNGILFLGSSETISLFVDLFSTIDTKWKIYRRRDSVYSLQPYMEFPSARSTGKTTEISPVRPDVPDITHLAEQIILQNYSPACVIVSGRGDILYLHGNTGKYLEIIQGEAKMNIFEMAREGMRQELPALVRKALSGNKSLTVEGIALKTNGKAHAINLTVKPVKVPGEMSGSLLIIFEEVVRPRKSSLPKAVSYEKKSRTLIKELEHQLKVAREDLRSVVEELESSNEELKSSNEEMQSTNEEMQSSNEELESSKEELQSLNEELITVNTELQNKNDELSLVNNDMKNLLDSTDIPTIFLDGDLRIKRYTFHATKIVNLIPSDVGRPISHLAAKFKYEHLIEDAEEVLRTLVLKHVELQTSDSHWYQMRILPYRTTNNVIDGVVITFSDINKLKTAYDRVTGLSKDIKRALEYADNIVDTVRESLLVLDRDLKVISANRSFYKMFGTSRDNTVGRYIYDLDDKKWDIPQLRKLLEEIIPKQNRFEDYEIEYTLAGKDGGKLLLNARQMFDTEKETKLILLAIQYKA